MYKGLSKLAQLMKLMAKDVSKEDAWWKEENVSVALGIEDESMNIIVRDDSGYRAIFIGDVRGQSVAERNENGYMIPYSENDSYNKGKHKWKYRCFPPQKDLEKLLQKIVDKEPLIPLDKNNCDSDDYWYSSRTDASLKFFSDTVKLHADKIAADKRTAKEIFEDCQ